MNPKTITEVTNDDFLTEIGLPSNKVKNKVGDGQRAKPKRVTEVEDEEGFLTEVGLPISKKKGSTSGGVAPAPVSPVGGQPPVEAPAAAPAAAAPAASPAAEDNSFLSKPEDVFGFNKFAGAPEAPAAPVAKKKSRDIISEDYNINKLALDKTLNSTVAGVEGRFVPSDSLINKMLDPQDGNMDLLTKYSNQRIADLDAEVQKKRLEVANRPQPIAVYTPYGTNKLEIADYTEELTTFEKQIEARKAEILAAVQETSAVKTINKQLKLKPNAPINTKQAGRDIRKAMGDPDVAREELLELKNIPLDPATAYYNDQVGFDAIATTLGNLLDNDVDVAQAPYAKRLLGQLETAQEKLFTEHNDFRKKQASRVISNQIYKDINWFQAMTGLYKIDDKRIKKAAVDSGMTEQFAEGLTSSDMHTANIFGEFANNIGWKAGGSIYVMAARPFRKYILGQDPDAVNYYYDKLKEKHGTLLADAPEASAQFGAPTMVQADAKKRFFLSDVKNPNANNFNWSPSAIAGTMSSGLAQMIQFGTTGSAIGKGLNALATVDKGKSAINVAATGFAKLENAKKMGTVISGFLSSYDDHYQAAGNIVGQGAENEVARTIVAGLGSGLEGTAELLFPDYKVTDRLFAGRSAKVMIDLINKKGIKALETQTGRQALIGTIKEGMKNTAVETGKEMSEEEATLAGDVVISMVANKKSLEGRDLGEEVVQTAITTAISSVLPIGLANMRNTNLTSGVKKAMLYEAGTDPATYINKINNDILDGKTPQLEADRKINTINRIAKIVQTDVPPVSPATEKPLTEKNKIDYAHNLLHKSFIEDKLATITDDVQKELYTKQLEDLKKERQNILNTADGIERDLKGKPLHSRDDKPNYKIAGKDVTRDEMLTYLASTADVKEEAEITGDDELQKQLEKQGGITEEDEVNIENERTAELEKEFGMARQKDRAANAEHQWQKDAAKDFLKDPKKYFEESIRIASENLKRDPGNKISQTVIDDSKKKLAKWIEINERHNAKLPPGLVKPVEVTAAEVVTPEVTPEVVEPVKPVIPAEKQTALIGRGYSQEEIDKMDPAEADRILKVKPIVPEVKPEDKDDEETPENLLPQKQKDKIEGKEEKKPEDANISTPTIAVVTTTKENPNLPEGRAFVEVKDEKGETIGTFGLLTTTGVHEQDGKKYASITGVSTTEKFRGKGRAIDLYRHALEEAKKLGFAGLYSSDDEVVDKKAINKIREKLEVVDIGNGEYLYTGIKPAAPANISTTHIQTARDNAGDVKIKIYKGILKDGSDKQVTDILKEVSDQWHDTRTRKPTEETFGQKIVDAAKQLYPQESNAGVVIENREENREEKPPANISTPHDLPRAAETVDGRLVRDKVSDTESIEATFGDEHEVLPGIREVSFSEFPDMGALRTSPRTSKLADDIKESGEISPLIVVYDKEGAWILEGAHRFDALRALGAKSFPAMVVIDTSVQEEEKEEEVPEVRMKTMAGLVPNDNGVYTEHETVEIRKNKKGQGVPDGAINFVQLENGKWISQGEYHTSIQGSSGPLTAHTYDTKFDTKEEALSDAAQSIIDRLPKNGQTATETADIARIKKWAEQYVTPVTPQEKPQEGANISTPGKYAPTPEQIARLKAENDRLERIAAAKKAVEPIDKADWDPADRFKTGRQFPIYDNMEDFVKNVIHMDMKRGERVKNVPPAILERMLAAYNKQMALRNHFGYDPIHPNDGPGGISYGSLAGLAIAYKTEKPQLERMQKDFDSDEAILNDVFNDVFGTPKAENLTPEETKQLDEELKADGITTKDIIDHENNISNSGQLPQAGNDLNPKADVVPEVIQTSGDEKIGGKQQDTGSKAIPGQAGAAVQTPLGYHSGQPVPQDPKMLDIIDRYPDNHFSRMSSGNRIVKIHGYRKPTAEFDSDVIYVQMHTGEIFEVMPMELFSDVTPEMIEATWGKPAADAWAKTLDDFEKSKIRKPKPKKEAEAAPVTVAKPQSVASQKIREAGLEDAMKKAMDDFFGKDFQDMSGLGELEGDKLGVEQGQIGVNKQQLMILLGAIMYNKPLAQVAVKELLQNSFDAVKAMQNVTPPMAKPGQQTSLFGPATTEQGEKAKGSINIAINVEKRTISIRDNGIGMTPDIVKNAFLSIGGTNKEGLSAGERSGGLGLAKVQFLLGSEYVKVVTVRNGIKTTIDATNVQLYNDDFQIHTSRTTEPNGSFVEVKIPERYTTKEGVEKEIYFPGSYNEKWKDFDILTKPLVGAVDVDVEFTDKYGDTSTDVVPIGNNITTDLLPPKFTKVKFAWGEADVHMSVNKNVGPKHKIKHQILSSGIYQFDHSFENDDWEKIPYDIVINIKPSVGSTSEQYPFNNQREDFKSSVKPDIASLTGYLLKFARGEAEREAVDVFSDIRPLAQVDPSKILTPAERKKIYDDIDRTIAQNKKRRIDKGEKSAEEAAKDITIGSGTVTNTKTHKVLHKDEKDFKSSFDAEKEIKDVDPVNTINFDPTFPQYHNNTNFDYTKIPGAMDFITDYGNTVLQIVRFAGDELGYEYKKLATYSGEKFFAGVSIDKAYGGVHVRKIINAIFVNPLAFDVQNAEAAAGLSLHIALHEINHTTASGEGKTFTSDLAKLYGKIYGSGKYGLYEGLFRSVFNKHYDTYKNLQHEYNKSTTRNLSKSFESDKIERGDQGPLFGDAENVPAGKTPASGDQRDRRNTAGYRPVKYKPPFIKDVVYHGLMVNNPAALQEMFPPVHPNKFYHHSTIAVKPATTQGMEIGKPQEIKIKGRLTTDKVDVLLVENPKSVHGRDAHITLSTAAGIKPSESKSEIAKYQAKIIPASGTIPATEGYNNGRNDIIGETSREVIATNLDNANKLEDPAAIYRTGKAVAIAGVISMTMSGSRRENVVVSSVSRALSFVDKAAASSTSPVSDSASRQKVVGIMKAYYAENDEKVPKDVLDRALHLWEALGRPQILGDSTKNNERAFAKSEGVLGNITDFNDLIAELAHAAQYASAAELDDRQYATEKQRDSLEYKRKGSVEYDAHTLIEPMLAGYIFSNLRGNDLVESFSKEQAGEAKEVFNKYDLGKVLNMIDSARSNTVTYPNTDTKGLPFLNEEQQLYGMNKNVEAFYSPLERFIEGNTQNVFTAAQVLGLIKNLPQNEIEAVGLREFLQGKDKVSKTDLLNYIRENKVNIEVIAKSDNLESSEDYKAAKLKRDKATVVFTEIQDKVTGGNKIYLGGRDFVYDEKGKTIKVPEEYQDKLDDANKDIWNFDNFQIDRDMSDLSNTQYGEYTLAGKKSNYREVLLTIPDDSHLSPYHAALKKLIRKYGVPATDLYKIPEALAEMKEMDIDNLSVTQGQQSPQFKSSHFDEPNIVAHLRIDDREIPIANLQDSHPAMTARIKAEGRKTAKILFVEESQSDWAREQRKQGVRPTFKVKQENGQFNIYSSVNNFEKPAFTFDNKSDADKTLASIESVNSNKVPDMPFKGDKWVELVTKKAIQLAAQEGYDGIAWINGEQTKERYDLSKQVKYIQYNKNSIEDSFEVKVIGKNNESLFSSGAATPKEIEDTLGKDVLDKMRNEDGENVIGKVRILKDDNLKVGGKWANNLYDKQIPKIAGKLGKQYGGKVTTFDIEGKEGAWDKTYKNFTPNTSKQFGIEITPAMRESTQSLPLFGNAQKDLPFLNEEAQTYAEETTQGDLFHQAFTSRDYSTGPGNVQQPGAKGLPANRNSIRDHWRLYKDIQFSGKTTVKNHADVAHIMRLLETKSVEHGFAVHVDKKGKVFVQFISIGGRTGTVMDPRDILAGALRHTAVTTYLVHNHPSGNLKPSKADFDMTTKIRFGLKPFNVKVLHIIVDTEKEEYTLIDEYSNADEHTREGKDKQNIENVITTEIMDVGGVKSKPIGLQIKYSSDAAEIIQKLRFGAIPKKAVLLLNQANMVLANHIIEDWKDAAALVAMQPAATGVIFYGNVYDINGVNQAKVMLKHFDIGVMDFVVTNSGNPDVLSYYMSAGDQGDLVMEPGALYGNLEEQAKAAKKAHDKAVLALRKAEDKFATTAAKQTGLFDTPAAPTALQGAMFGGRDDIKEALDPLRKKVAEAATELERIRKQIIANTKATGQQSLFETQEHYGTNSVREPEPQGLSPEEIKAGTTMVAIFIQSGVYKLEPMITGIYEKLGDRIFGFEKAIKNAYSGYRDSQATDEEADKMDTFIRKIDFREVIENFKAPKPQDQQPPIEDDRMDFAGKPTAADLVEAAKVGTEIKERFAQAPKLIGGPNTRTLPDGTKIKGRFIVTTAAAVTPSHNPVTYETSAGFPLLESGQNPNDRNYKLPANQAAVVAMALDFGDEALSDVPTVDRNGVVLDGNNRTMSGQVAASQHTDTRYMEALVEQAYRFGITNEELARFMSANSSARVYFVPVGQMPYTTATFARFNKTAQKEKSPIARAIELGRTVPQNVLSFISNVLDRHETVSDLYQSPKDVKDIFNALVENSVLTEFEIPKYFDRTRGLIENAGKEFLETLLIGNVVGENELSLLNADGVKSYRHKIAKAIKPLAEIRGFKPEFQIGEFLNEAIGLKDEMVKKGISMNTILKQLPIFGKRPSLEASVMLVALEENEREGNRANPAAFKNFIAKYATEARKANNGEADIFDPGSKPPGQDKILDLLIENYFKNEEQRAAIEIARKGNEGEAPGGQPDAPTEGPDQGGAQGAGNQGPKPEEVEKPVEKPLTPDIKAAEENDLLRQRSLVAREIEAKHAAHNNSLFSRPTIVAEIMATVNKFKDDPNSWKEMYSYITPEIEQYLDISAKLDALNPQEAEAPAPTESRPPIPIDKLHPIVRAILEDDRVTKATSNASAIRNLTSIVLQELSGPAKLKLRQQIYSNLMGKSQPLIKSGVTNVLNEIIKIYNDAAGTTGNLEPDSPRTGPPNGVRPTLFPPAGGPVTEGVDGSRSEPIEPGIHIEGSPGISPFDAPTPGEPGDPDLFDGEQPAGSEAGAPGSADTGGSGQPDEAGVPPDEPAEPDIEEDAEPEPDSSFQSLIDEQAKVDPNHEIIYGDRDNINATLPLLKPGQQEDVHRAERRFIDHADSPELMHGKAIMFTNGTGTGKAENVNNLLFTPNGKVRMGDIKLGDYVIGKNGQPTEVTGVYPQGEVPMYKVIFSDNSSVEVCEDHLWHVESVKQRKNKTRRTGERKIRKEPYSILSVNQLLEKNLRGRDGRYQYSIPMADPVQYEKKEFPLHPYVLGALLGDGHLVRSCTISTPDEFIVNKIASLGVTIDRGYSQDKEKCPRFALPGLVPILSSLNIRKKAEHKSIPEQYLFGSVEQRIDLLNGLMDTDGYCEADGTSSFYYTISETLAHNVIELVQSLGGTALKTVKKNPKYTYNDEVRHGQDCFVISVCLPASIMPFTLPKKAERHKPKTKYVPIRYIDRIEYVGEKEAQCISVKAEDHLYCTEHYVVTHNTLLGAGIAKRLAMQGKGQIVIIVPTDKKAKDWIEESAWVGLPVTQLSGITDAPSGAVVTTYANFRANQNLQQRQNDIVIYDEAHKINSNAAGENTANQNAHAVMAMSPRNAREKARDEMNYMKRFADLDGVPDSYSKRKALEEELNAKALEVFRRTKVVFLSATPFSYHKSLKYADGFLFPINERVIPVEGPTGYGQSHENSFFVSNFGYRVRYGKLTMPEHGVDVDLLERQFTEGLKKKGVISSRKLSIPVDYSRQFVLMNDNLGRQIDEGMEAARDDEKYRFLPEVSRKRFDFLYNNQLMEALKARWSVDRIKKHLAMGRQVVIFHTYIENHPTHPFDFSDLSFRSGIRVTDWPALDIEIARFHAENPQYQALNMRGLTAPIETITNAFGDRVRQFNGRINKKVRGNSIREFNDDKSNVDILIVQMEAGKEGISLHDKTGVKPRVEINLGLPYKPTDAIQAEGRIYRTGQKTDAIFEYPTLNLNFERIAFANKINERVRTAENLAMGEEARNMEIAFREGYVNAVDEEPNAEQGKGGKADDARMDKTTEFEKSKTYYWKRGKRSARDKSNVNGDYYATPEPIGLKMVEWLKGTPNERQLEPSAGHGAIARFMSKATNNLFIEPNIDLRTETGLNGNGEARGGHFEDLHVVNKFHGIAMNPPFGHSAKLAMEHLVKATSHLLDGGRIVALVPTGQMDKRLADWMESPASDGFYIRAKVMLPSITFVRAATAVNTQILIIDRIDNLKAAQRTAGQDRNVDLRYITTIPELFNAIEDMDMPDRVAPSEEDEGYGGRRNPPGPGLGLSGLTGSRDAKLPDPVPDAPVPPAPIPPGAEENDIVQVVKNFHAKKQTDIFVVKVLKQIAREDFVTVSAAAKQLGGYYSGFKGSGAIPGFVFNDEKSANELAAMVNGHSVPEAKKMSLADRIRTWRMSDRFGTMVNILPVASVWNLAVNTVAAAVEGGVAIANALKKGYDQLKSYQDDWDRDQYSKEMINELRVRGVLDYNLTPTQKGEADKIIKRIAKGANIIAEHNKLIETFDKARAKVTDPADIKELNDAEEEITRYVFHSLAIQQVESIQNRVDLKLGKETRRQKIQRKIQNKYKRGEVIKSKMEDIHIDFAEDNDFVNRADRWRAIAAAKSEEMMHKVGIETVGVVSHDVFKRVKGSLLQRMSADNIDIDKFGVLYLTALHAPERNAHNARMRRDELEAKITDLQSELLDLNLQYATNPSSAIKGAITKKENELQDHETYQRDYSDPKADRNKVLLIEQKLDRTVRLMDDGGSGMTNQQAADILKSVKDQAALEQRIVDLKNAYAKFDVKNPIDMAKAGVNLAEQAQAKQDLLDFAPPQEGKEPDSVLKYEEYKDEFRKLVVDQILIKQLEYGLLTQEEFDFLGGTGGTGSGYYTNYVPLKIDPSYFDEKRTFKQSGLSGSKIWKSKGANLITFDYRNSPFIQSIGDLNDTIYDGEKNLYHLTLGKATNDAPDEKVWSNRAATFRPMKNKQGRVFRLEEINKPNEKITEAYKDKGQKRYLVFHDEVMAATVKETHVTKAIPILSNIQQYLRVINTVYNPAFTIANLLRDMQAAGIVLTALQKAEVAKNYFKNIGSIKAIISGAYEDLGTDTPASKWAKISREYRNLGGFMSWWSPETATKMTEAVQKAYTKYGNTGAWEDGKEAALGLAKWFGKANQSIENASRVSAYKALIDAGIEPYKAVEIARNVTINFNKKGEWGPILDSLYLFINAGTQGTTNFLYATIMTKRGRMIAGGIAMLGMMSAFINAAFSDCDDKAHPEDCYDNLKEYEKEHNYILKNPFAHGFFKIPMSYGFSFYFNLGENIAQYVRGKNTLAKSSVNIVSSLFGSVNPVGGSSSTPIEQQLAPTVLDLPVQYLTNRDYFNRLIWNESDYNHAPDSEKGFAFDSEAAKGLASWMNRNTGGDEKIQGMIDVSPGTLDMIYETGTGGLGQLIKQVGTVVMPPEKGLEPRDIPIFSRFYTMPKAGSDKSEIYDLRDRSYNEVLSPGDMEQLKTEVQKGLKIGDLAPDQAEKILETVKRNQVEITNQPFFKLKDRSMKAGELLAPNEVNKFYTDIDKLVSEKKIDPSLGDKWKKDIAKNQFELTNPIISTTLTNSKTKVLDRHELHDFHRELEDKARKGDIPKKWVANYKALVTKNQNKLKSRSQR